MTMFKKSGIAVILLISGGTTLASAANEGTFVSTDKSWKQAMAEAKSAAMFLTANDTALARIFEDAMAVCFVNEGISVPNREMVEKKLGEQVTQRQKEETGTTINAFEMARELQTDLIVTGTVVFSQDDKRPMVSIASIQLLDVKTEKTLFSVVFDYEQPATLSALCRDFMSMLGKTK